MKPRSSPGCLWNRDKAVLWPQQGLLGYFFFAFMHLITSIITERTSPLRWLISAHTDSAPGKINGAETPSSIFTAMPHRI